MLDADAVSAEIRDKAGGFLYNTLAPLFALNLALDEPPLFSAAARRPELNRAFMVILGLERFPQFHDIVAAHELGQIPGTVMWGACPTLFDAGQAPPGKHTAFMWEKVPYALRGSPSNWEAEKETHGRTLFNVLAGFAPNLRQQVVIDSFARSPVDTERDLPQHEIW